MSPSRHLPCWQHGRFWSEPRSLGDGFGLLESSCKSGQCRRPGQSRGLLLLRFGTPGSSRCNGKGQEPGCYSTGSAAEHFVRRASGGRIDGDARSRDIGRGWRKGITRASASKARGHSSSAPAGIGLVWTRWNVAGLAETRSSQLRARGDVLPDGCGLGTQLAGHVELGVDARVWCGRGAGFPFGEAVL